MLSIEANEALSSSSQFLLISTLADGKFCLAESGGPKYNAENVGFLVLSEVELLAVE